VAPVQACGARRAPANLHRYSNARALRRQTIRSEDVRRTWKSTGAVGTYHPGVQACLTPLPVIADSFKGFIRPHRNASFQERGSAARNPNGRNRLRATEESTTHAEAASTHGGRPLEFRRLHPGFRHGHTFTDRDRVDGVPGQASASEATIMPPPKNADAVPAPAAGSLPRISAPCRSPSDPRPVITIASIQFGRPLKRPYAPDRCAATADRGWWPQGAEARQARHQRAERGSVQSWRKRLWRAPLRAIRRGPGANSR
jgi:hypothetical protein